MFILRVAAIGATPGNAYKVGAARAFDAICAIPRAAVGTLQGVSDGGAFYRNGTALPALKPTAHLTGKNISLARATGEFFRKFVGDFIGNGSVAIKNAKVGEALGDVLKNFKFDKLGNLFSSAAQTAGKTPGLGGKGALLLLGLGAVGALATYVGFKGTYRSYKKADDTLLGRPTDKVRKTWVHATQSGFAALTAVGGLTIFTPVGIPVLVTGLLGVGAMSLYKWATGGITWWNNPRTAPMVLRPIFNAMNSQSANSEYLSGV